MPWNGQSHNVMSERRLALSRVFPECHTQLGGPSGVRLSKAKRHTSRPDDIMLKRMEVPSRQVSWNRQSLKSGGNATWPQLLMQVFVIAIIIHSILLSNQTAPITPGDCKIKCRICTVARPTDKIKSRIVRCYYRKYRKPVFYIRVMHELLQSNSELRENSTKVYPLAKYRPYCTIYL